MSEDSEESHQSLNDESTSSSEETLEFAIEEHLKLVNDYESMDTSEKIKNIDSYNTFISNIEIYEEELEEYKARLNKADKIKKKNEKIIPFTSKTFSEEMAKIIKIKNTIEEKEVDSLDELIELYENLRVIQRKIVPYLEEKKLEILKI